MRPRSKVPPPDVTESRIMDVADRLAHRETLAGRLSSLSDKDIRMLLHSSAQLRLGIGGAARKIEVAGCPVFVKTISLSNREVDAGPGDTRNLFNLPPWYHYGVGEGSTGFNAWREVAAHEMVSDWVASGECPSFPLLYHWRIMPDIPRCPPAEDDILRAVRFWGDSPEVEHRLRALSASATVVAVFIEHVPNVLTSWLHHQLATSSTGIAGWVTVVVDQLLGAAKHMRGQAVVHFDTHLDNVLTTGEALVVSDFGLLAAAGFQLDGDERLMLTTHADHDVAYCAAALTNAILGQVMNFPGARARNDWIRRCAHTGIAPGVPDPLAATIRRLAPTATLTNDFYWQLHDGNVQAPFPAAALATTLNEMEQA